MELTDQDREEIQNQIIAYQQNQITKTVEQPKPLITPDGKEANKALDEALEEQATPDKKESRRVKKKIKGIWRKWRYF